MRKNKLLKYIIIGVVVLAIALSFIKKLSVKIEIGMNGEIYDYYTAQNGIVVIMRSTPSQSKSLKKLGYLSLCDRDIINQTLRELKEYENTTIDTTGFMMSDANYYTIDFGNKHHTVAAGNSLRDEEEIISKIAAIYLRMNN